MELTWIGFILLPMGILFLVFKPKFLFYFTIISIPFASTSLLNSASGSPLFSVQYFGTLFILRFLPKYLISKILSRRVGNLWYKSENLSLLLVWLFTGTVLLTMIMPYLIQGKLTTIRGEGFNAELISIDLTLQSLSQVLPALFGAMLITTFVMHINTPTLLFKSLRIYTAAVVFVAFWGLMQFFLENVLHISYPYWIFNTAVSETTLGYLSKLDIDFVRITSVAFEPSMFAKQNLIFIPLLFFAMFTPNLLFGRTFNLFFLILLIFSVLLSASTTGFIGIPLSIMILSFFSKKFKLLGNYKQLILISLLLLLSFVFILSLSGIALEILDKLLINKNETDSSIARIFSISNGFDIFTAYPILGVGWGFVTSHDLIINLLANSGIIGLITFMLMSLQPLKCGFSLLKNYSLSNKLIKKHPLVLLTIGLIGAELLTLMLGLISGYEFYLAYPYITLGFLISSNLHLAAFIKKNRNIIYPAYAASTS
jgi:hypothetical protein